MKILVTGSAGQLGHEIMRQAASSVHTYIFTDMVETSAALGVVRLDITDRKAVEAAVTSDIDVIVNCAAFTDVNRAQSDHDAAFRVNADAVSCLAEAALRAEALLIHVSTDYVFDGKANVPYKEDSPTGPLNEYGRSKLEGERAVAESGCRYMIFRSSWLYSNAGNNFFLKMAEKTAESPEVKVVIDQVGTPTNAYDLAELIAYIIEEGMLDRTGIYNYSNLGVCSWYDFASEICSLLGHACRVVPCRSDEFPSPAQRPCYSVLDKSKVMKTFGIEIPHWRDSLVLAVREYMQK